MHEYSIVAALLGKVEDELARRGADRVCRLRVAIGELSGVELDLLQTAYDTFRERTACADAPMEIHSVPARWSCSRCGRGIGAGEILRCASCGQPARLTQGDEIVLERIEMEVADV